MAASRQVSLPAHGAVEFLIGMAMILAPVALGLDAAGIVVSAALGSVLMGTALTLTGHRTPHVAWHNGFDTVFVIATALVALALALAGDGPAAVFLAAVTALQAALNSATRYVSAY
jgi:hypothetical protein